MKFDLVSLVLWMSSRYISNIPPVGVWILLGCMARNILEILQCWSSLVEVFMI